MKYTLMLVCVLHTCSLRAHSMEEAGLFFQPDPAPQKHQARSKKTSVNTVSDTKKTQTVKNKSLTLNSILFSEEGTGSFWLGQECFDNSESAVRKLARLGFRILEITREGIYLQEVSDGKRTAKRLLLSPGETLPVRG